MRDSEKKVLLITILIGIIIIGGLLLWKKKGNNTENNVNEIQNVNEKQYVQVLQDGSKVNISEELRKTKALDGLEITNIQLKENGGITTLLADVENKSGANVESKKVQVEILNKNGETITILRGRIDSIKPGEKVQLNMSVTANVANAYDFKISNY